jgi:glycosyltransferase involved in cell wall biosynthesis
MTLSVVIPCFNAEQWVKEALDSVEKQTRPAEEVILVDDGSTDKSLEIVLKHFPGVRICRTNRANVAGARNAGIAAASGKWIAFLDADDCWYPDHLERAARALDGSDDVAYLAHNDLIRFIDGKGKKSDRDTQAPFSTVTKHIADHEFFRWYSTSRWFYPGTLVARRDVLLEIGGFDVTQVRKQDHELFLRLIKGRTWCYDPEPGAAYRFMINEDCISSKFSEIHYYSFRALVKNERYYGGREMDKLLRYHGRQLVRSLVKTPDKHLQCLSWRMIMGHFNFWERLFYRTILLCAPVLRFGYYRIQRST